MQTTLNLGLKKPESTDNVNIEDLNGNMDVLDIEVSKKVDKVTGKQLSTEDYTTAEKTKLAGIAAGANNYVHPSTHPASIITQDSSNRFVTDAEKNTWNAKETTAGAQAKADAVQGNLVTHLADNVKHITAGERSTWNGKLDASSVGNASGNVPISNGTVNTNLNADLLDGKHANDITHYYQNLASEIYTDGYFNYSWVFKGITDAYEFYYYHSSTSMRKINIITGAITDLGAWPVGTFTNYAAIEMAYVCPNGRLFISFNNDNALSPNYQRNLYTYYNGTWTLIAQISPGSTAAGGYGFGMEIDSNTFLVVGWSTSGSTIPYYKLSITTGSILSSGNVGNGGITPSGYATQAAWGGTGYYVSNALTKAKDGDYVVSMLGQGAIRLSDMVLCDVTVKGCSRFVFGFQVGPPYRFGFGVGTPSQNICSYRGLIYHYSSVPYTVVCRFSDNSKIELILDPQPVFNSHGIGIPSDASGFCLLCPYPVKYNFRY